MTAVERALAAYRARTRHAVAGDVLDARHVDTVRRGQVSRWFGRQAAHTATMYVTPPPAVPLVGDRPGRAVHVHIDGLHLVVVPTLVADVVRHEWFAHMDGVWRRFTDLAGLGALIAERTEGARHAS